MGDMPRSIVVGVDGGGSKTDCVVTDVQTGRVLGRASGGASNWYHFGFLNTVHKPLMC